MRCFMVRVHGRFDWLSPEGDPPSGDRPLGFHTWRFVVAPGERAAQGEAFVKVRRRLKRTGWLVDGEARLALEAEAVTAAPMHRILEREPGNRFYMED